MGAAFRTRAGLIDCSRAGVLGLVIFALCGVFGGGIQAFDHIPLGDLLDIRIGLQRRLTETALVVVFQGIFVGVEPGFHYFHHPEDGIRLRPRPAVFRAERSRQFAIPRAFAVSEQDVPGRRMLSRRDVEIPLGSPACGDDPELALRSACSFPDLPEEGVKSGLEALVALEVDANLAGHLPAAPADFAFPPKLAQSVVLEPIIQFVLREPLELSAVVEVAFADQHRFGTIGKRVGHGWRTPREPHSDLIILLAIMNSGYQIVVCAGIVPDPLQTLEPVSGAAGPALKNENMLPAILDPWAAHALYEAAHLASQAPGSKVWLVSLGPKAKLQQVMMTVAQKAAFEFVAVDGAAGGFTEAHEAAAALAEAIRSIEGLDMARLLLYGGWESASRGAGATLQMLGEQLGIVDQFQGVDELRVRPDGALEILERVEGGRHQLSVCAGPPAALGWATGNLGEPRNNPQIGMANLRGVMPALQRAKPFRPAADGARFLRAAAPRQQRETRVVKDLAPAEIAREIAAWISLD